MIFHNVPESIRADVERKKELRQRTGTRDYQLPWSRRLRDKTNGDNTIIENMCLNTAHFRLYLPYI